MDAIYCEGGWEFETAHGGSLIEYFKVLESRITLGLGRTIDYGGWRRELVRNLSDLLALYSSWRLSAEHSRDRQAPGSWVIKEEQRVRKRQIQSVQIMYLKVNFGWDGQESRLRQWQVILCCQVKQEPVLQRTEKIRGSSLGNNIKDGTRFMHLKSARKSRVGGRALCTEWVDLGAFGWNDLQ